MKMLITKSMGFLLLIVCLSCNTKGEIGTIDASRDTLIKVTTHNSNASVLKLTIKGEASDTFLLQYYHKIPGGKIDTTVQNEWYDKNFVIDYKAYKAKSGKLSIKYHLP
jgi:hypothetical protein